MNSFIKIAGLSSLFLVNQAFAKLPDTPVAFSSGVGAMVGDKIYIGLGSAGQNWYCLNLKDPNPQWKEVAFFPDMPRDQAQAIAIEDTIYVLGGCGKSSPSASKISVNNDVYAYNTTKNEWKKLMTRSPIGLTGHSVFTLDNEEIYVIGSVNKEIFNGYFEDVETAILKNDKDLLTKINSNYMNMPCEDYFFNRTVLKYNVKDNIWSNEGTIPGPGTSGSAVAVSDDNKVFYISGEKKPGLRTDAVYQGSYGATGIVWDMLNPLPILKGDKVQEGLAGAFAGFSNGALIVIGGNNFPGATSNYENGQNFAHNGCVKTWRDEIYVYEKNKWSQVGKFPMPLANGVCIQDDNKFYIIGGQTSDNESVSSVETVIFKNGKVLIE